MTTWHRLKNVCVGIGIGALLLIEGQYQLGIDLFHGFPVGPLVFIAGIAWVIMMSLRSGVMYWFDKWKRA